MYCLIYFAITSFLILIYLIRRNLKHLDAIPMPPCNVISGHIFTLFKPTEILDKITSYSIQYGGIIRIYIPPVRPTVVVTCPKIIHLLTTSKYSLNKAKDYQFFDEWLGKGLIFAAVSNWQKNRRRITPYFGRLTLMTNFVKIFEKHGDQLVEHLSNELDNRDFDITSLSKSYTMDILCETSMGVSIIEDKCKQKYFKIVHRIIEITLRRMCSAIKRFNFLFILTQDARIYRKDLKVIEELFEKIVSERIIRQQEEENDEPTILDMLLKLKSSSSMKYIQNEVNNFLLGGNDTAAAALAFTLYALSKNPEIQEKVLSEQIDIFGKPDVNSIVSYADLQKMKYLEMVINESLRMYPPIPLIGRKIDKDIVLDSGVVLPKNLNVVISIYGCHHDPKHFPEPDKFQPERFLSDIIPCSFIPFSNGPRNCIGRKFALLLLKSSIAKIIRNFHILPANTDYEMKLFPSLVLTTTNGVRISLKRRKIVC